MESKIIRILQSRERQAVCARSRQQAIANKSFIGAMFFHLEFLLARDDFDELMRGITSEEFDSYIDSCYCEDHL
jgi:hypothetical protein